MRLIIAANRREAVLMLQLFAVAAYLNLAQAHICEVGKEKDETDTWMWVLPYDKPCLCTQIVMGGMNTWTPIRPFQPTYVERPLLSDNVTKIRKHYKLSCGEEAVTESVPMSASLKTAPSSTELGISSKAVTQSVPMSASLKTAQSSTESGISSEGIANTTTEKASTPASFGVPLLHHPCTSDPCQHDGSCFQSAEGAHLCLCDSLYIGEFCEIAATSTTATERASTSALFGFTTTGQGCVPVPLGMQSGEIPNSSITASSYQRHVHFDREPKFARLGQDKYWANDKDNDAQNPWIQVDLGRNRTVTGLKTQGYGTYYRPQINVKIGMSEGNLMYIADNLDQPKVFNADPEVISNITLDAKGIPTRFVRIYPVECKRKYFPFLRVSCILRFEILGC